MNEDKIRFRWYGNGPVNWMHKLGAKLFSMTVKLRSKVYSIGIFKTHLLKAPVIVVGNITAGGGGKTPMVIWLATHLKSLGYKPGIVSRGYGGKRKVEPMFVTANANSNASGDEPLLIAKKTQLPVMVGKNRVKAAQALIRDYHVNVIVSDDGMQHLSMGRAAEIVMLDAKWQAGNQLMIPAGPLREPIERLKSVDLVVYKGFVENQHHYEFEIDAIHQLNHRNIEKQVGEFRNKKVVAMAGIANPKSFFAMLSAAGLPIVKKPMSDHHLFTEADFEHSKDTAVLITEKDAVKCENMRIDNVWVVKMRVVFPNKTLEALDSLIKGVMHESV